MNETTAEFEHGKIARYVRGTAIRAVFVMLLGAFVPVNSTEELTSESGYVGSEACATCHAPEYEKWRGSHHDLAMQPATTDTVLGDFSGTNFTQHGVKSRFFERDGRFFINTEGADGAYRDFEVAYTFGVEPLQQYLITFPNGALQAFGVAWDTRAAADGGQRWFHVYGDEKIPPTDELHWSGRAQNWNYQCADCHSLNVRKHYDAAADSYATTWAVIDVGCEGCHGPGGDHVRMAPNFTDDTEPGKGLTLRLNDLGGGGWVRAAGEKIATRSAKRDSDDEVNACARCHSRRAQLRERAFTGQSVHDDYRPSLLSADLYHLDGQIDDEVYVYGSFLQSRMHKAGVVCSDCHDPHSGRTHAPDNTLCTACHAPEVYDTASHHHHKTGSSGARCVECHMPAKNYMVIDARRDHSMRIPRPDLSVTLGTPNACNNCHADERAEWAADHISSWRAPGSKLKTDYGELLAYSRFAGRDGLKAALALINDDNAPAIIQANALRSLGRYAPQDTLPALVAAANDDNALLRRSATEAARDGVEAMKLQLAIPNTYDDLLSVRIAAARVLATVPPDQIPPSTRETVSGATAEYVASQQLHADQPQALVNLGILYNDRGEFVEAEAAFRQAHTLTPDYIPATLGLADVFRATGKDQAALSLLREAIARHPGSAELQHALGLVYVREKQTEAALEHLARAAELAPDARRYHYVLAIARRSYGEPETALSGLEATVYRFPNDIQMLLLLAELSYENNQIDKAIDYAEQLVSLVPNDPRALEFLRGLSNGKPD